MTLAEQYAAVQSIRRQMWKLEDALLRQAEPDYYDRPNERGHFPLKFEDGSVWKEKVAP